MVVILAYSHLDIDEPQVAGRVIGRSNMLMAVLVYCRIR